MQGTPLAVLTDRELQTLALIADGLSNEAIARRLSVSVKTVETLCAAIFRKLDVVGDGDVNRRVKVAGIYYAHGLVPADELGSRLVGFVGRRAEIDRLAELVDRTREVTITGPGGSGKTALAVAVAVEHASAGSAAHFVDLVPVRSPDDVVQAVCDALGVVTSDHRIALRRVRRALGADAHVLILDNAEHVATAVGWLVGELRTAPGLKVVVTSRSPLDLDGEVVWPIPPLAPDDAAALLAELAPSPIDDDASAAICRAADGLPLAIRLVAARLRSISVGDLVTHLDHLPALVDTAATNGDRHARLAFTLDSTEALLGADARRVLHVTALLPGGFGLHTAAACAAFAHEDIAATALDELVRSSLVNFARDRYRMLEPVRQYALDKPHEHDRCELRRRVVAWAARWSGIAATGFIEDPPHWSQLIDTEHTNIAAAVEIALDEDLVDDALRIVGRLGYYWTTARGASKLRLALRVVDRCDETHPPHLRGRALTNAANLGSLLASSDRDWTAMFRQAIHLLRDGEDDVGLGAALYWHARHTGSIEDHDNAIAHAERTAHGFQLGWSLIDKATVLMHHDAPAADVLPLLTRAESVGCAAGLPVVRAGALMRIVACACLEQLAGRTCGDAAEITGWADEAEAIMREANDLWQIHEVVFMQARRHLIGGDLDAAAPFVTEAITVAAACESAPILREALLLAAALKEKRADAAAADQLVDLANAVTTAMWNPQWLRALPPRVRDRVSPRDDAQPAAFIEVVEAAALALL